MIYKTIYALSILATILQPEQTAQAAQLQETVSWLIRAILALGLGACAYLLREAATTMKETKADVAKLAVTVATHQIMFEHWIDSLASSDAPADAENPGRRLSDKIIKEIVTRGRT